MARKNDSLFSKYVIYTSQNRKNCGYLRPLIFLHFLHCLHCWHYLHCLHSGIYAYISCDRVRALWWFDKKAFWAVGGRWWTNHTSVMTSRTPGVLKTSNVANATETIQFLNMFIWTRSRGWAWPCMCWLGREYAGIPAVPPFLTVVWSSQAAIPTSS